MTSRALCRRTFGRSSAWGVGRSAGWRLSGDPRDIYVTDHAILKAFPKSSGPYGERLHSWILGCHKNPDALLAGTLIAASRGLRSRACPRGSAGWVWASVTRPGFSSMTLFVMARSALIVIGRDHLDCGSVASPNRETEAMKDGSDAISDWAILNALVNTASGASWVSFHHGGGVGIGYSQHAGQVIVADGTPEAARRLERVLRNDPSMGVFRHADAGYDDAVVCAKNLHADIPMLDA